MRLNHWLIHKLGGTDNTSDCPFSQEHLNLKLRQVGNDKFGIISTSYPLSDEQFQHIKREASKTFPGYEMILLECLDVEMGTLARAEITAIHNKLHDLECNHRTLQKDGIVKV